MDAELYRAAKSGSIEAMRGISNWKDQQTPTLNNVLHLHVGKSSLFKKDIFTCRPKKRDTMVDSEFIEHVLHDEDGYWLLWKQNSNGDTPLHLAARFGHSNAVRAFLRRAKEVYQPAQDVTRILGITNKQIDTALHEAARAGHPEVVELLLGADPHCSSHARGNENGETPLYLAAERGSTPSVLSILQTCDASHLAYKGPCGRTALHAAVQWGDPEMVEKLLEKNRSVMCTQNEEGETPLHCAAVDMRKIDLLKILLAHERGSSAVYIQDNMGRSPLHIAMLRKNVKALDELIESCPDCIEIVDHKGQNVLHYAAIWAFQGVHNWAVKRTLHLDEYINDKDENGDTPLHILATSLNRNPDLPFAVGRLKLLGDNYPSIDHMAFDKQNHNVGDILRSFPASGLSLLESNALRKYPRGRRSNTYESDNFDCEKAITAKRGEWDIETIKKATESRLIVAALIATVSFTAAFTVPGGLDQNPGGSTGMPVLGSKTWFKVFIISDGIAFTTSATSILLYFVLVSTKSLSLIRLRSSICLFMNSVSLAALMIAFVAAVCAISSSKWMLYLIIAMTILFFYFYLFLIRRLVRVCIFLRRQ